jgi:hypothetical protein
MDQPSDGWGDWYTPLRYTTGDSILYCTAIDILHNLDKLAALMYCLRTDWVLEWKGYELSGYPKVAVPLRPGWKLVTHPSLFLPPSSLC